ncbi:hypothetical protein C8J46_103431 [Sphingomonas sp. PP-F2F-A104-K0414]|nr:hypothetical protein C8J46_103431 [Sphingomonas sp. PP-F2F-A104-K0414]
MLMPEAAVDEDRCTVSRKDKVGFSWQVFRMQPVAKACRVQRLPDRQLGFGMAAPDRRHIPAARGGVVNIRHGSGSFAELRSFNQRRNVRQHDARNLTENRHGH